MGQIKVEGKKQAFICTKRGKEIDGIIDAEVNVDGKLLGAYIHIYMECPDCRGIVIETDEFFREAVSILIKKNYLVDKAVSCQWGDDLYNPYIKIQSGSLERLEAPVGWRDVTHESVKSFQVFAPINTYGTEPDGVDPSKWSVKEKFACEDDFNYARDRYTKKLVQWAKKLPENTTIRVAKDLSGDSSIVDAM